MALGAPLARQLGLTRIGIHHSRLLPGRRTSYPHAESAEEEFVFVLEGKPDVWIDGVLHRLAEGDAVSFPAGDGNLSHVHQQHAAGRAAARDRRDDERQNRIRYPMNEAYEATRPDRWIDWPRRALGPHDGKPDDGETPPTPT